MRWCPRASRLGILACVLHAGCDEDIAALAHDAEQARELAFVKPVPVRHLSRADYMAEAQAQVAGMTDADLRSYAETYGRLGFFSIDLDLRPIYTAVANETVAAYYSDRTQSITLVGPASHDELVHELVHGLQDQHFDLSSGAAAMTSDAALARAAVVEGDATLAQLRYLAGEEGLDFSTVSFGKAFETFSQYSYDLLQGRAVPLLYAYSSFAYAYGLVYCAANLTGATFENPVPQLPAPFDWSREDALFGSAMPATTRDIVTLHAAAAPAIGLHSVPPALADRFELVDWDSLGLWDVFLLLTRIGDCGPDCAAITNWELTSSWNGDGVLFVRQRDTGANGFVWVSSWTSGDLAQQLASELALLHGFLPDLKDPRHGVALNGEPMWIEVRDTRVVVVRNIDATVTAAFAEAALNATAAAHQARLRPAPPYFQQLVGSFGQHATARARGR